jgi:hypothetical protein
MLRSKSYIRFDNNDNVLIWRRKIYVTLKIRTQDLVCVFFSTVSTYKNKNSELLDYATTMWNVIGAIYEHVFSSFPTQQLVSQYKKNNTKQFNSS